MAARSCWVLPLDNVSHIQPWLSDCLCRLATGGGWATRELYTDDSEVLFEATRPVVPERVPGVGEAEVDPIARVLVDVPLAHLDRPFDYTVPQAVLKLKQGFGRLIRSKKDTGMVVILDPRVLTKGYGRTFLDALPQCRCFIDGMEV